MVLRLRLYGLSLKLSTYLLSIFAFLFGLKFWTALVALSGRPLAYVPRMSHLAFGMAIWALFSEQYGVTKFDELFRERTGARNAISACAATSFVLLATLYFSRNQIFPRGLLICDVFILLLSTIVLHAIFRSVCRNRVYLSSPVRMLIIGADKFAYDAAQRLKRLSFSPCEIVGSVRIPGQEVIDFAHRVYDFDQLSFLNSRTGIDEVVIAIRAAEFHRLPVIIAALKSACLPARAIVDLGEGVVVREKLFQLGNMQMLDLTSTPTESLDYALLKRAFDVVFSMIVLIFASPLLGLIAATIKITSKGPVLFVQERIGLNGKPFHMYKFRTMRTASQAESDVLWTRPRDPRVTTVGAILRKTSLDELPQFINVLRGDMSVVGPRPERPHFVDKFLQEISSYDNRHTLKVGITGWAQVNGWRGDTSIEKRIEFDLYYLQNWSLSFDLRIIVMTLFSGLIARHAY